MSGLSLSLHAIPGIPLIEPGDDLAMIILNAIAHSHLQLLDSDIVVVAQKIISKSEGRIVDLDTVTPSKEARNIALQADKDPRLVELILQESNDVIRCKKGVIIVEHRSGIVMANAGIDHSNVGGPAHKQQVSLLPEDANASASTLCETLQDHTGKQLGVIINDSVGRAWRLGTVGIAIGSSAVLPLRDLRGQQDLYGEILTVSETADVDALACAACMLMGEAADASPVVIVRGHQLEHSGLNTGKLIRAREDDLFR